MGFTYVANAKAYNGAAGASLACSTTLDVAAGDVLVCAVGCQLDDRTMSVATSIPNNAMTMLAISSYNNNFQALGYRLIGEAQAGASFVVTYGGGTARYRSIIVIQFRPDSGDTPELAAGPSPGSGNGASMASGSINPDGDDLIVMAAANNYGSGAFSSEQIGAVAADLAIDNDVYYGAWYKLYTSAPGSITGTATGATNDWVCDSLAINAITYVPPITDAPEKLRVLMSARWR